MGRLEAAISWIMWPAIVTFGTCATYLGFQSDHDLATVFLVVNVAMMIVVIGAEQLLPWRKEWNPFRDRQSINDLGHGFVQSQLGDRLGALIVLTTAAGVSAYFSRSMEFSLWPSRWPLLPQILLVIAIGDGLDYWKHRFLHTVPWLWRFHALHHGISRLHVFKASRNHFTEILLRFLLVYSPLVIVGTPPKIIFWYTSFISILGLIGHSNVRLRVPAFMHSIFMTPQYHRLHHSIERSVSDTNYVNILPIWDILFGTFTHPNKTRLTEVGVLNDPIPPGFLPQVLSPFIWTRLVRVASATRP